MKIRNRQTVTANKFQKINNLTVKSHNRKIKMLTKKMKNKRLNNHQKMSTKFKIDKNNNKFINESLYFYIL